MAVGTPNLAMSALLAAGGAALGLAAGYAIWGGAEGAPLAPDRRDLTAMQPGVAPAEASASVQGGTPASGGGSTVLTTGSVTDQVEAFRKALKAGHSLEEKSRFYMMLAELTPEVAPHLIEVFRELGNAGFDIHAENRLFWERWGEVDGRAANEAIFLTDRRFEETELSSRAIGGWARTDPGAAASWLMSQEDIPLREGMTKGMLDGMAQFDPEFAQRFIADTDLSYQLKAHGYWRVAREHLTAGGLDAIAAWYGGFSPDDPLIKSITRTAADIVSDAPVPDALDWLGRLDGDPESVAHFRNHVRDRLVRDKPDLVVWTLGMGAGPARLEGAPDLAAQAVAGWTKANPNAMGQWLGENPALPSYDLVAVPFVRQVADQDPASAAAWAGTLHDPEIRKLILEELGAAAD